MSSHDRHKSIEQLNLISRLMQKGHLFEAKKRIKELLQHHPKNQEAILLLVNIYQHQGDNSKAISHLNSLLEISPCHQEAHRLLARLHFDRGNNALAFEHIKIAEPEDEHCQPSEMKGVIQASIHQYDSSIKTFLAIIDSKMATWSIWNNLGNQYRNIGESDNAKKCYLEAIKLSENNSAPYNNLLTFMHYLPESRKEKIKEMYDSWEDRYTKRIERYTHSSKQKLKNKKIRIGMVSDGFRNHPVGQMITSTLEALSNHEIEIYAYSTNLEEDHITIKIKKTANQWKTVTHLTDEELADELVNDEIDILFDLCGHNNGFRMKTMAMKPAPILVKWVGGLINTTGLSTMDYLMSDSIETPVGEDKFYTEKLIRMPDDYICYNPPIYTPDVLPPPARRNKFITLGCFNNPTKINHILLSEWVKIMHSLPGSRLFLKGYQFSSEALREKIKKKINSLGICEKRLIIEGPSNHEELLKSYNKVDIALDTWPYSGGLTTCEAMYMGVPVVTFPGPTFAGRHSATHLTSAGMPQLVAESWEHYHDLVIMLANDIDNLANIRTHLRSALLESPVCDAQRFARNFSNAIRAIWQRHCEGKEPAALNLDKEGNLKFTGESEPVILQLPEEPITVESHKNDDFRFRFDGKIMVVDNGAALSSSNAFSGLHKLNVLKTICLDVGSQITNSQQLQHIGEFYHYPMTVLGDGNKKTLYATVNPSTSSTLAPSTDIKSEVIAELPISSVRLDNLESLQQLDWIVLDYKHHISDALSGSINKVKDAVLIQVRIHFLSHYESQTNLESVSKSLADIGFSFYDFKNNCSTEGYSKSGERIHKNANFLNSADAIFIPSTDRIKTLNKNKKLKLAFLAHTYLEDHQLCSSILLHADENQCLAYEKSNIRDTSKENKNNHNIDASPLTSQKSSHLLDSILFLERWQLKDRIKVVDIGANPIDGLAPYHELLQKNMISLIGFEPQQDALAELNRIKGDSEQYLPYAIGDGEEATLYICQASGMTSTLKPNFKVLNQFQGYPEWAKIKREENIETVRLDDINEIKEIDWLKIDIQGGELTVFNHAEKKLKNTLVIQTEVNFIQLYEKQPLFAEVDQWMRSHGFILHTLLEERKRLYAPLIINNQIHQGLNQLTTADAVYIKDTTKLELLTDNQKLKMATILHMAYYSYDLAFNIIQTVNHNLSNFYLSKLPKESYAITRNNHFENEENVFIIGCGHTGTTLMATILGTHSNIHTVKRETNWFLSNNEKFESEYTYELFDAKIKNKNIICEKTPKHIYKVSEIEKRFPKSKFLIMTRDAKDTISSIKNRTQDFNLALERWCNDNEHAATLSMKDNCLLINYEDLIENSKKELEKICEFIGVEYEESLLCFYKNEQKWFNIAAHETDGKGESNHLKRRAWQMNQKLTDRRGLWQENLSDTEAAIVDKITEGLTRKLKQHSINSDGKRNSLKNKK